MKMEVDCLKSRKKQAVIRKKRYRVLLEGKILLQKGNG